MKTKDSKTQQNTKRHKWLTVLLLCALVLSLLFSVIYTLKISSLQQITLQEKRQSDEQMNLMLDELFDKLTHIGRVDVLQSVTEQNVKHLAKQDPRVMSDLDHLNTAKAYMKAGKIFEALDLSQQGKQAYLMAKDNLRPLESLTQHKRDNLLGEINVGLSQVLRKEGQEVATETILIETIRITDNLLKLGMLDNPFNLWEAYLQLGWHYLEYGKAALAIKQSQMALALSEKMLSDNFSAQWLFAHSKGLQLKGWYEIEFGSVDSGVTDLNQAADCIKKAIDADPDDFKMQKNQSILINQMANYLFKNKAFDQALPYVTQAAQLAKNIHLKSPSNLEYQRDFAVSLRTAGEVTQQLDLNAEALHYFSQSLLITEFLAAQAKGNFSPVNDFAIDTLLVANLNHQLGDKKEAQILWQKAADLMRPIHQSEPNNPYYTHTLLVALIQLKKYKEAKPLYHMTIKSGIEDQLLKKLIKKHKLSTW